MLRYASVCPIRDSGEAMKVTEYKVGNVKCVDDGKTRGVVIGCEGHSLGLHSQRLNLVDRRLYSASLGCRVRIVQGIVQC